MPESLGANAFVLFVAFFLGSLGLTELVRKACIRFGFVNRPAAQRWSQRVVSLGGGIAISVTILIGFLWVGGTPLLKLMPAFLALFILGLVDDVRGVQPAGKLVVQALAATFVASQGYLIPMSWPVLAIPFTILWYVGVTNSVNLIDNMDGLAGGAAMVASLGLAYLLNAQGDTAHATLAIAVAAASAGFLAHNFYPARIFMGDAGSLALGFVLAVLSSRLRFQGGGEVGQGFVIIPVALLLIVPLFDTALVMISRSNARRPIMSGGRDHTSHRLVQLGLSEPRSVLLLYLFGGLGVLASGLVLHSSPSVLFLLTVFMVAMLGLLATFFLDIAVYPPVSPGAKPRRRNHHGEHLLPLTVMYAIEIAIDICVISFCWAITHYLRFEEQGLRSYKFLSVIPYLPYVISIKITVLASLRLYRGLWRAVSAEEVYRIFKAVSLSTLLLIAALTLSTRLEDVSRIVIVLDWLFTFVGLWAARMGLGSLQRWTQRLSIVPGKVALIGSPLLAEAVRAALKRESSLDFAGTIVSDPTWRAENPQDGILGPHANVREIVAEHDIDMLIVTSEAQDPALALLAAEGVTIRRLRIQLG